MNMSARLIGLDDLAARLEARLNEASISAALDRASARLAAAATARGGTGVRVDAASDHHVVGSDDPAAVARETGSLQAPAVPWLLPARAAVRGGEGI